MSGTYEMEEIIEQAKKTPVTKDRLRQSIRMMDLTSLNEEDSTHSIVSLCDRAHTPAGPVAAVCVYPRFVDTASKALEKSTVKVATVINFPSGEEDSTLIASNTADAINAGAHEIDVVFDYNAFLSGNIAKAREKLKACRSSCPTGIKMKVILESGTFSNQQQLEKACLLAMEEGADFLKTSTGKIPAGASFSDAAVILRAIRFFSIRTDWHHKIGFKVSGGVRTSKDAATYQHLASLIMGENWIMPETFRIGASSLKDVLLDDLGLLSKDKNNEDTDERIVSSY